ncbi:MAG: glycosyltransferase family 1 protein [Planctomycetota bacterium]|jgi:glycosyltransferase involved in cell wall biosynthesis|nr:glycosyltransferase family 1 protein [Planctomycetota bacterium]MDP6941209.1 glycosyltransferase family 1 protein [Planctomycetota bacterium]
MTSGKTLFINARFLTEPMTGLQRSGIEILSELHAMLDEGEIDAQQWRFVLLAPDFGDELPDWPRFEFKAGGIFRSHLWEQLSLPRLAKGPLLCLKNTAPIRHTQLISMIHDALVWEQPDSYSISFGRLYRFLLPRVARRSRVVLTPSKNSADLLSERTSVPRNRFVVVSNGHEHALRTNSDTSVLEKHSLFSGKYLIAVSSHMKNKNFYNAARAVREAKLSNIPLVVVGGANPEVFEGSNELPDNCRTIGRVGDSALRALYENSLGLIFPSFHEGFGLPPLEAMALGCPVIVSQTSSLPEVCGDAALYCNPSDVSDIARQVSRLANDRGLVAELKQKGLAQAKKFSWRTTARTVWKAVEENLS